MKGKLLYCTLLLGISIAIHAESPTPLLKTGKANAALDDKENEALDSLKSLSYSDYFMIDVTYDGYESGNHETWYYDSLANLSYFYSSWDMEGSSGERYYWFHKGNLYAVYEETLSGEEEPEIIFETSPSNQVRSEIAIENQKIIQLINKNLDKVIDETDTKSITLEEVKDYGIEFTEKTEITIDSFLWNRLFKDGFLQAAH